MDSKLMNALLAMDAYNRGYDVGLVVPGEALGDAEIIKTQIDGIPAFLDSSVFRDVNNDRLDDNISFYALAYDWNGQTIISYRGTDDFPQDVLYGYTLGGGFPNHQQAEMALGFLTGWRLSATAAIR